MRSPSLVHSLETTGTDLKAPLYRDCIRKHCRLEWTATQTLYRHFDQTEGRNREETLLMCRTRAWFVRNRETGNLRVASNSCRLRWCPLCARARQGYIWHQVSEWFETADHPKFLTVTIKHSQESLTNQINKIYQAFRQMRKDKFFKMYCTGGIWFFQICWNPKRHEWHPHIHAIVTGQYMDYKELRRIWLRLTGDSQVLDIRVVRDPKVVGDDVARYAARPVQLSNLPTKQGIEAMMSLYGRRMAGSWGTGRAISFRPKKIPDPENWEYMGNWSTIHELAAYDDRAKAILKAYYSDVPLGKGFSCYEFESFIDGEGSLPFQKVEVDPRPPPTLFN